ncbi:MAG: hypothetical protein Q8Q25_01565, partial [bacterium]|nr:hypothetical protein [bacterium]
MKKMTPRSSLLLILALFAPVRCGMIVDKLEEAGQKLRQPVDIFVGVIEEKKQQLATLQEQKNKLVQTEKNFFDATKKKIDVVDGKIKQVKSNLIKDPDDEFLNKIQFILSETYQVLQDVIRTREQLNSLLDDFIKQLTEYLQDPDFTTYKKTNKLIDRLYYSFEDLQKVYEMILEQERHVAQLTDQEKNVKTELEARKRSVATTLEKIKEKQDKLRSTTKKMKSSELDADQNNELLRTEEHLYESKKELDSLRLQEIQLKLDFFVLQIFVAKSELGIVKEYFCKIKPSVRVSEADLAYAKDEFAKWK